MSPVKTTIKAALDQAARCAASETSENYDALDALTQMLDGGGALRNFTIVASNEDPRPSGAWTGHPREASG